VEVREKFGSIIELINVFSSWIEGSFNTYEAVDWIMWIARSGGLF